MIFQKVEGGVGSPKFGNVEFGNVENVIAEYIELVINMTLELDIEVLEVVRIGC